MTDPRITTLAKAIINFSCKVRAGDNVLIEVHGDCEELALAMVKAAYEAGGIPYVWEYRARIQRALRMGATEAQLNLMAERDKAFMGKMQAYVGLRGGDNISEMADVPAERTQLYNRLYSYPVHHQIRVKNTNWVVLRYPAPSMAQLADMSTEAFEDFYFDVCNLDYGKMNAAMEPLRLLMDRTENVRVTGVGTELSFSIKGIRAVKCAGERNIPDGEIYTAPVKDSVNGTIQYNTPSVHNGFTYEKICLTFKDGKIVKAAANDTVRINKALDIDAGARCVGEFALGVHPYITKPMKDTLFDEKISGSMHFTPGSCYEDADNGNKSALHWDLVYIQTPEYGGGEMYFDGVLVRKDGRFVLPELLPLNPENLK